MQINEKKLTLKIREALTSLPQELRDRVAIDVDHVKPQRCSACGCAFFLVTVSELRCVDCAQWVGTAVRATQTHRRFTVSCDGSAVLVAVYEKEDMSYRLQPTTRRAAAWLHTSDPFSKCFYVKERARAHSVERFQALVERAVFTKLGLATDAEGCWGWPGGQRLTGGEMIPTMDDYLDLLCGIEQTEVTHG